jgi:hypothetical protein
VKWTLYTGLKENKVIFVHLHKCNKYYGTLPVDRWTTFDWEAARLDKLCAEVEAWEVHAESAVGETTRILEWAKDCEMEGGLPW